MFCLRSTGGFGAQTERRERRSIHSCQFEHARIDCKSLSFFVLHYSSVWGKYLDDDDEDDGDDDEEEKCLSEDDEMNIELGMSGQPTRHSA